MKTSPAQHLSLGRRGFMVSMGCACAFPALAQAPDYPGRTVRFVFPYSAGGGGDSMARVIADKLSELTKQAFIVENKVGASGIIATEAVVNAAPDGYTLLVHAMPMVVTPATFSKPPYDPVKDLTAVAELISAPLFFGVNTTRTSARTLKEFVEQVKKEPNKHFYAGVSPGSTGHLYGFQFAESNGLAMTHVGYKGAAPALMALLGGEISAALLDMVVYKPHLAGGKIRLLAVTGKTRSRFAPDVPTFLEQGYPGYESNSWGGLFAPRATPQPIVQKLATVVTQALRDPVLSEKLVTLGYDPGTLTLSDFAAQVAADRDHFAVLVRKAGIKAD